MIGEQNRIITLKSEDIVKHNNNYIILDNFCNLSGKWFAIGKILETSVVQNGKFCKVYHSDDISVIDTSTSSLKPLVYCKCNNNSIDILTPWGPSMAFPVEHVPWYIFGP